MPDWPTFARWHPHLDRPADDRFTFGCLLYHKDGIGWFVDARRMTQQLADRPTAETTTIDVRAIPRPMRHPLIFNTFDRLDRDESIHVVSDHDPRPLHYLFDVKYSGVFTWDYVEEGPDAWCIRIGRRAPAEAG